MASIGKWNAPSAVATILTTELNALANNTMTAASTAVANQTNLDLLVDVEVVLASLSPAAGAYVAIYVLEAVDGSNYPTPSDADLRLMSTSLLVVIPLGVAAATAQRVVARNVVIPPGTFKVKLDNQAGVALGATLNTVKFLPYDYNLNG
jgi:hypothetical protein